MHRKQPNRTEHANLPGNHYTGRDDFLYTYATLPSLVTPIAMRGIPPHTLGGDFPLQLFSSRASYEYTGIISLVFLSIDAHHTLSGTSQRKGIKRLAGCKPSLFKFSSLTTVFKDSAGARPFLFRSIYRISEVKNSAHRRNRYPFIDHKTIHALRISSMCMTAFICLMNRTKKSVQTP